MLKWPLAMLDQNPELIFSSAFTSGCQYRTKHWHVSCNLVNRQDEGKEGQQMETNRQCHNNQPMEHAFRHTRKHVMRRRRPKTRWERSVHTFRCSSCRRQTQQATKKRQDTVFWDTERLRSPVHRIKHVRMD